MYNDYQMTLNKSSILSMLVVRIVKRVKGRAGQLSFSLSQANDNERKWLPGLLTTVLLTLKDVNMNIQNIKFSLYNSIKSDKPQTITFAEFVAKVKEYNPHVAALHKLARQHYSSSEQSDATKQRIASLKQQLAIITPAGCLDDSRSNDALHSYNALVQVDIDLKHQLGQALVSVVKSHLASLPSVAFAAVSPTGYGVKALIITDASSKAQHKHAALTVSAYIERELSATLAPVVQAGLPLNKIIDTCGKAISQPLYIPFDADCFVNYDAQAFELPAEQLDEASIKSSQAAARLAGASLKQSSIIINQSTDTVYRRCMSYHKSVLIERTGTENSKKLIGYCNRQGLSEHDCENLLSEAGYDESDVKRVRQMYNLYSYQHACDAQDINAMYVPAVQVEDARKWHIKAGEYISSLDFSAYSNESIQIVAPTGSGKTHLQFDKRELWLFPTTQLASQFARKHPLAATFWQDSPNRPGLGETAAASGCVKVISTYDSVLHAVKYIAADIANWTVVFDECHHFVTSSSRKYKYNALTSALQFLPLFRRFVALTATPLYNEIPDFQNIKTINVTRDEDFTKTLIPVVYNDSVKAALYDTIAYRNNPTFIYINSTDPLELSQYEDVLSPLNRKVHFVNSQTKTDAAFESIIMNESISPNDIYIVTSVIAEGVSITTELEHVDIYFATALVNPVQIEQICRRFRRTKNINALYLRKLEHVAREDEQTHPQIMRAIGPDGSMRNTVAELCNEAIKFIDVTEGFITLKDIKPIPALGELPLVAQFDEHGTSTAAIDSLLFENALYRYACAAYASSPLAVWQGLELDYGWNIDTENCIDNTTHSDEAKAAINLAKHNKLTDVTKREIQREAVYRSLNARYKLDFVKSDAFEQQVSDYSQMSGAEAKAARTERVKITKYAKDSLNQAMTVVELMHSSYVYNFNTHYEAAEYIINMMQQLDLFNYTQLSIYKKYIELSNTKSEIINEVYDNVKQVLVELTLQNGGISSNLITEVMTTTFGDLELKKCFNTSREATNFARALFFANTCKTKQVRIESDKNDVRESRWYFSFDANPLLANNRIVPEVEEQPVQPSVETQVQHVDYASAFAVQVADNEAFEQILDIEEHEDWLKRVADIPALTKRLEEKRKTKVFEEYLEFAFAAPAQAANDVVETTRSSINGFL